MKVAVIPIVIGALVTVPQRLGKGAGRVENQRTSQVSPDFGIDKTDQNTEKKPEDLNKLVVT